MIHEFRSIEKQFRLIEIDRCSLKNFKTLSKQFRLIKKQFRLIEIDRGFLRQFKRISIDRKIDWINQNWQRLTKFEEKTLFLKKNLGTTQSIEIEEQNA